MKTLIPWKLNFSVAGAIMIGALAILPARAQNFTNILEAQSPIDWWRFDETTTSPVINTVSNQGTAGAIGTGYVIGGVLLGVPGVIGTSAYLTNSGQNVGNCTARIDIPNNPVFNPEPPFTIEFWAKPNSPFAPVDDESPPTGLAAVSSISVAGSGSFEGARSGYIFYASPVGWEFRIGGLDSYTAVATATFAVSGSGWTHVVGQFDGTTSSIYINGVLSGSASAVGAPPFQPNNFMPTRIGGTSLPGDEYEDGNTAAVDGEGNRGWDGGVSELAVYNTLLSSNTIAQHYSTGTNNPSAYDALVLASSPVGYWNLQEPAFTPSPSTGTFAADAGLLVDDGTNTVGSLADQPGVAGTGDKSVFYSGSAGSLVLNTNVAPTEVGGSNLTLAAWINPVSFGYVSDIIAQGYDETSYSENFLRVGNSFDWAYFQDNSSGGNYNAAVVPDVDFYEIGAFTGGNPGYVSAVFPAPAGDIGHWVFLVGTFDGVNWNLYRNGSLVAQFGLPPGYPQGPAAVTTAGGAPIPWSVGSRSNPNEYFGMFFAGSIAEPTILTNALDEATISNLYNSVELPPVITQAPVAPSPAYLGSVASLSVWADGPGALTYQWSYNGAPQSGQTGTNFTLTGLTPAADGTYSVIVKNTYGSATSSAVLLVTPSLPPVTVVPAVETRWLGFPLDFAPASLPNQQLSFQWDFNGAAIAGATQSNYTAAATSGTAGTYTLIISNSFGVLTSTPAVLSLKTAPNLYVSTILGDHPLSYLRLDEPVGSATAYDYAGGNNGNYIGNITLGVPGYSLIDTDTAAFFPGVAATLVDGIDAGGGGPSPINFDGTNAEFSIEAWANGPANQPNLSYTGPAVVAKGHSSDGTTADEQFAITDDGGFYSFFVRDSKGNMGQATAKTGPDGNWHHLVGVCDYQGTGVLGPGLTLYIDGAVAASGGLGSLISSGIIDSQDAVSIGAESSGPGPDYLLAYEGTISQVAIYATNLSPTQVANHYAAAYGPNLPAFITLQPVSVTNYVTYPVTLLVNAAGTVPLNYQWYQVGVGPIAGATDNTYTIPSLATGDAGTYTVSVSNTLTGNVVSGTNSVPVTITVLQVPTTPPAIAGLVMHLTFDNTLVDATGRGNNATNMASGGAPINTNPYTQGQIGEAFSYTTTVDTNSPSDGGTTNAQYATLGVRPDLQFGADTSFTVSMWIQLPPNYGLPESPIYGNDLPFFTDAVNSTFGTGFLFAPSYGGPTADWPGGWAYSIYGTSGGLGYYGKQNVLNDGGWHSLIFVLDRTAPAAVVYFDGVAAAQNTPVDASESALSAVGNINVTNVANIGQDPTGLYAQGGSANIDDLAVWQRALTPLEAESIFLAGSVNQLSFTGAFSAVVLPGPKLELIWDGGSIQSSTNLNGPWTTVTNATSPYIVTPTGTQEYFRAKL
jgi:hypothetical protein